MKRPVAQPVPSHELPRLSPRSPRALQPGAHDDESIDPITENAADDTLVAPPPRRMGWIGRVLWSTAAALLSIALGLAAARLIARLFAAQPWLGWLGLALLGTFVVALLALLVREYLSVARLRSLDRLRARAITVLTTDTAADGRLVLAELRGLYDARPDLARASQQLEQSRDIFDGGEMVRFAERTLMAPLDARARSLTAASARRVALVTTVSPRALVDIAFVVYESLRLGGQIARLYGARPGLLGTWRLFGAILTHLAVTGGLVLTDGVVEQLVGQGLAAKLSARLGEGIVNGLMTVRVGIAAMRVVRPLPFDTQRQPRVKDFIPELANVLDTAKEH